MNKSLKNKSGSQLDKNRDAKSCALRNESRFVHQGEIIVTPSPQITCSSITTMSEAITLFSPP
jgi:hypothetical protein